MNLEKGITILVWFYCTPYFDAFLLSCAFTSIACMAAEKPIALPLECITSAFSWKF